MSDPSPATHCMETSVQRREKLFPVSLLTLSWGTLLAPGTLGQMLTSARARSRASHPPCKRASALGGKDANGCGQAEGQGPPGSGHSSWEGRRGRDEPECQLRLQDPGGSFTAPWGFPYKKNSKVKLLRISRRCWRALHLKHRPLRGGWEPHASCLPGRLVRADLRNTVLR